MSPISAKADTTDVPSSCRVMIIDGSPLAAGSMVGVGSNEATSSAEPSPSPTNTKSNTLTAILSETIASMTHMQRNKGSAAPFDHNEEQLHLDDTDIECDDSEETPLAHGHTGVDSLDIAPPSRFLIICSWCALIGSVFSMSSTGPMFLFLQRLGVSPILACVWRTQCTTLVLLIPAFIEWRRLPAKERSWSHSRWRVKSSESVTNGASHDANGRRRASIQRVLVTSASTPLSPSSSAHKHSNSSSSGRDWHAAWYVSGVALVWSCSLVLWVNALPYTTTARASLLTSIYPLLLCLYLKFGPSKVSLSTGEILGVCISFLGIATCEIANLSEEDSPATTPVLVAAPLTSPTTIGNAGIVAPSLIPANHPLNPHMLLVGDGLCIASAFFIAADILISKKARSAVPLFMYTLLTTALTLCLLIILSLLLEGAHFFSLDPHHGVFGWMTRDHAMVWLNVGFGILDGGIGLLGFNFAVKYIHPLIFSSIQLLDPGVTGLMSWIAGLESFPTRATFAGIGVVAIGIAVVFIHQQKREEAEKNGGANAIVEMRQMKPSNN